MVIDRMSYGDLITSDTTNAITLMLFLYSQHKRIIRSPLTKRISRVKCNDGFTVSIQVGKGYASTPTRSGKSWYSEVELQYPTAKPQQCILDHLNGTNWTTDRYFNVQLQDVVNLLINHGGINWIRTLDRTLFSAEDIFVLYDYITSLTKKNKVVFNTLPLDAKLPNCKPVEISIFDGGGIVKFRYDDESTTHFSKYQFLNFYRNKLFAIKLQWVEKAMMELNDLSLIEANVIDKTFKTIYSLTDLIFAIT
jgi:hypothetical protein